MLASQGESFIFCFVALMRFSWKFIPLSRFSNSVSIVRQFIIGTEPTNNEFDRPSGGGDEINCLVLDFIKTKPNEGLWRQKLARRIHHNLQRGLISGHFKMEVFAKHVKIERAELLRAQAFLIETGPILSLSNFSIEPVARSPFAF